MLGTYKTLRERSFRISNVMVFTLPVGNLVKITQVDKERRKVLVDFGDGYSDWMHFNVLKDLELVEDGIQLDLIGDV